MRLGILMLAGALVASTACGTNMSRRDIERAAGVSDAATPASTAAATGGTTTSIATGAVMPTAGGPAAGAVSSTASRPAAPQAAAEKPTLSPVKIGHIGTYSGLLGAIFTGGQQMTQVWANWVNAHGGLNGHPVQVVTGDDGGDPSRNLALTRDMVENQGVIAFMGNIVPLSLNGSKAYLEQHQVPLIGGDLTDVAWYQSPMIFPQGALIDGSLKGAAQVAVEDGGKNVALLYCSEATSCTRARDIFQQGAVERAGGKLVYTAQVSLAQPDFTSECLQMRTKEVNAVVATVDGNSLSRLARSCTQQGVKVRYVSFALALVSSLRSDRNLDGLIGTTALFPWMLSDGPAADYAAAIRTYGRGLDTSGSTSAVWGSGQLLAAAARRLPATNPTSKDLLEGLYALRDDTLGGLTPPLTFRRGQPPLPYDCYYTIGLGNGAFGSPSGLRPRC